MMEGQGHLGLMQVRPERVGAGVSRAHERRSLILSTGNLPGDTAYLARPFANPVFAQFEAVLLCGFLAVKDRTLDTLDFYNRAEAAWTKNHALRVPLKSSCKGWRC